MDSYDAVLKTFLAAKQDLGEILSSCEMIDSASLQVSINAYNLRLVIVTNSSYSRVFCHVYRIFSGVAGCLRALLLLLLRNISRMRIAFRVCAVHPLARIHSTC